MKKQLLLILLAGIFTLASCSSDDDGGVENNDPIVGTWVLVGVNPPLINTDDCPEESTITFNDDNSGTAVFYLESNDCEPETTDGNWENKTNSQYVIEVPIFGRTEGTVEFEGSDEFRFTPKEMAATFTFERE